MGNKKDDTVVVVDGANDLKLFELAAFTVGFCPVDIVKEKADVVIEIRDLTLLLNLLEKKFGKAGACKHPVIINLYIKRGCDFLCIFLYTFILYHFSHIECQ